MKSKLVRDNIPTIIREAGRIPVVHIAGEEEAKAVAIAKIYEEVEEFKADPSLEEAGDVYQAFMTILLTHNMKFDDVIKAAVNKSARNGRFDKMIVLDDVL